MKDLFDIAVIGSGPGGAITSCIFAESGFKTILFEDGASFPPDSEFSFSLDEIITKYRNGGVTSALGNPSVQYAEACCLGGGSEINSGLYHRIPKSILESWINDFSVESLTFKDLLPYFLQCENDLSISKLPYPAPLASLKLKQGAESLKWNCEEVPRWVKYTSNSNIVERQTMTATYIPRSLTAGTSLVDKTKVYKFKRSDKNWHIDAVQKIKSQSRKISVKAKNLFLCGGAIQTPYILRRNGVKKNIGNTLALHVTAKVVAEFPDEVNSAHMGVPVHQVKEFAPEWSLGCSISSPIHLANAMFDHPKYKNQILERWKHAAIYYVMITGKNNGKVRNIPGFNDPLVRCKISTEELVNLGKGMRQLCHLLFKAGANFIYPSIFGIDRLSSSDDISSIPVPLERNKSNLMTIHLTSSCPMGENKKICATDSFGKVWDTENLYINDASLLCTAPSVNPQGSVMAIAYRNAMRFVQNQ
jgi:choline dehydrogenase-like flavoprotein